MYRVYYFTNFAIYWLHCCCFLYLDLKFLNMIEKFENNLIESGEMSQKIYIFCDIMKDKESEREMLTRAIKAIPRGKVFSSRDIKISIGEASLRQNLKRLVDSGFIRRAQRGFFERPIYSQFLQENLATDMLKMAESIAKNNCWTIAPTGNTALNLLGLSTQVPANWTFVSDGPYKKYDIGGKTLEFRHRANRNISGHSSKTNLVIHALKSLPEEQISDSVIEKIRQNLTEKEKEALLRESVFISRRIFKHIKRICGVVDV